MIPLNFQYETFCFLVYSSRRNTHNFPHPPSPQQALSPRHPKFVKQYALEVDFDARKTENLVSFCVLRRESMQVLLRAVCERIKMQ